MSPRLFLLKFPDIFCLMIFSKLFTSYGLNPLFYSNPLDTYYSGVVSGTKTSLQSMMHQTMLGYALEKGGETVDSPSAFATAALVAAGSPSAPKLRSWPTPLEAAAALALRWCAALGATQSGDCPGCFRKGFRNKQNGKCGFNGLPESCRYVSRSKTASRKALVTPVTDLVLYDSAKGKHSDSDALISAYEDGFSSYQKAIALRSATAAFRDSPASGSVANVACVNFCVDGSASVACPSVSAHDSNFSTDEDGSAFVAHSNTTVSGFFASLVSVNPVALVGHSSVAYYWDNACSVHITSNIADLDNLLELANPFPIGGIGSSVVATHVGHLSFLPPKLSRSHVTTLQKLLII